MRIAFITTEYPTEKYFAGGLANYLYRVSLILHRMGHKPEIFVSSDKDEDLISDGIPVHRVLVPSGGEEKDADADHPWVLASKALNDRLAEKNRENRFDIVQYSNWMATGIHRAKNIPAVVRISSFQPLWFSKDPGNTENIKISTAKDRLELKAIKGADSVFGPSQFLANEISKFVKKYINVIETPFELETKEKNMSVYNEHLKDKKYFLFFGRLSENKGVNDIAEIIYDILKINPDIHFVFIGDDCPFKDKTYSAHLKDRAGEYSDRVIYMPALRHPELYPVIEKSYAVVLPSRVDNMPNTCLEAMAHNKIVIGTRGASFEQLIEDGKNGFLAEKRNSKDLLKKISQVLEIGSERREQIEKSAKERIDLLDPDRTVVDLLELYKRTIDDFEKRNKSVFSRCSPDGMHSFLKKIKDSAHKIYRNRKLRRNAKKMKLIMTLLVRDEIDIIRKNIEFHFAKGVDFIVAMDNGSVDGTLDVLKEYEKKGVLHLIEEPTQDYSQADWVNRMGRLALEKYGADVVFHCDADEFWFPKSGDLKKEIMEKKDVDVLRVSVVNVLLEERIGKEEFPEDNKWAVVNPRKTDNLEEDSKEKNLYLFEYPRKVFYRTKKGYLEATQGNHDIVQREGINFLDSEDIVVYHYPLRGKDHFFRKIINGGSAYEANERLGKEIGFHWRRWYESHKAGKLEEEYKKLILTKEQAISLEKEGIVSRHNSKDMISK